MAQERSDVLVRMPAELKRRLVREVEARGSNLNDLAVEILASRFAVPFQGSGRRAGRPSSKGDVLLRMPAELKSKLTRRARERKRTTNQLIVETLSEQLDNTRPTAGKGYTRARGASKTRDEVVVARPIRRATQTASPR